MQPDPPWTDDDLAAATSGILKASGGHDDSETFARYALDRVAAQLLEREPTQPVADTIGARTPDSEPCCDLHGRNCEQGGEECCERCTEAHHFAPGHGGVPCSAPDETPEGSDR